MQCYEWVLRKAQGLDWAENSAKALVVIGDEKPHDPFYTDANVFWKEELDVLIGMGVKVNKCIDRLLCIIFNHRTWKIDMIYKPSIQAGHI